MKRKIKPYAFETDNYDGNPCKTFVLEKSNDGYGLIVYDHLKETNIGISITDEKQLLRLSENIKQFVKDPGSRADPGLWENKF